jgi:hypothetical protein
MPDRAVKILTIHRLLNIILYPVLPESFGYNPQLDIIAPQFVYHLEGFKMIALSVLYIQQLRSHICPGE